MLSVRLTMQYDDLMVFLLSLNMTTVFVVCTTCIAIIYNNPVVKECNKIVICDYL